MDYTIDELVKTLVKVRYLEDLVKLTNREKMIYCDFIGRIMKEDPESKEVFEDDLQYCSKLGS